MDVNRVLELKEMLDKEKPYMMFYIAVLNEVEIFIDLKYFSNSEIDLILEVAEELYEIEYSTASAIGIVIGEVLQYDPNITRKGFEYFYKKSEERYLSSDWQ